MFPPLPDELKPVRPTVIIKRVKCPLCKSPDHTTDRSINQGDGSRYLWKTCRGCRGKFAVIIE
ncbi:hypothetical protein Pan44_49570 [Caulifigura coniformis]|uniref:Uncharacterized protein n=1 Tax=Caulifigura coniformis TaxID=2527983 RepID=A0A517SL94_9PLAN|nr:hypothetical protein [Caulifigura coniformis]QDT56895.1 hypothetical protein Pan44_49570 [Caulifigura coniformis]